MRSNEVESTKFRCHVRYVIINIQLLTNFIFPSLYEFIVQDHWDEVGTNAIILSFAGEMLISLHKSGWKCRAVGNGGRYSNTPYHVRNSKTARPRNKNRMNELITAGWDRIDRIDALCSPADSLTPLLVSWTPADSWTTVDVIKESKMEDHTEQFLSSSETLVEEALYREHRRIKCDFPRSIQDYCANKPLFGELLFSLAIFALGYKLPSFLFIQHIRSIPYQNTANGDIILDLYIDRDYVNATVPSWLLVLSCDVIPILVFTVHGVIRGGRSDIHSSLCAFGTAMGITGFLTNSIKLYAGYFRPCFYNYCGYNKNSNTCESSNSHVLTDSRLSFPSGHSSNAFCSMTLISLYFLGKVGILHQDSSTAHESTTFLPYPSPHKKLLYLLALCPMLWAFFVASSRVHDDMHHPADIVAGSLIGYACARIMYRLWYPAIDSYHAGIPYYGK